MSIATTHNEPALRSGPDRSSTPGAAGDDDRPHTALGATAGIGEDRLPTRTFAAALIAITLIAAGLRLYQLDGPSFWLDELFTIRSSADNFGGQWSFSKSFGYLPTTVALALQGVDPREMTESRAGEWRAMGVTEFRARLASCLIGIATIPIIAIFSRRVIGDRAAVLAALLMTFAVWHIQRSQDARFYSQQLLFFSLAVLVFFRATQLRSNRRMIAALGLSVAAFASQPTALMIVGIFACDWILGLLRRRPVFLGWVGWSGGILLTVACAAVFYYEQQGQSAVIDSFIGRQSHSPLTVVLGSIYMVGVPVAAAAVVTFLWLIRRSPRLALYLALAAVLPMVTIASLALVSRVGVRYTFVCEFAWIALAALGLAHLQSLLRPQVGWLLASTPTILVLAGLVVPLWAYYGSASGYRAPWRDVMQYIDQRQQPGESVRSEYPLIARYYLQSPDPMPLPIDAQALREIGHPVWMAVVLKPQIGASDSTWIEQEATLKKVFVQEHIARPERLGVFYYHPVHSPGLRTPPSP